MSDLKGPITLSDFKFAIKDLTEENLNTVKSRLSNSISRLTESNDLMKKLLNKKIENNSTTNIESTLGEVDKDDEYNDVSDGDVELFQESIGENEKVIENQQERIEAIEQELSDRGVDMAHSFSTEVATEVPRQEQGPLSDNEIVDSTAPNSIFI